MEINGKEKKPWGNPQGFFMPGEKPKPSAESRWAQKEGSGKKEAAWKSAIKKKTAWKEMLPVKMWIICAMPFL